MREELCAGGAHAALSLFYLSPVAANPSGIRPASLRDDIKCYVAERAVAGESSPIAAGTKSLKFFEFYLSFLSQRVTSLLKIWP